jgi:nitrogen regulatory protein PII
MYVITANISANAIDEMKDVLLKIGVSRLRIAAVNGYTRGHEREIVFRGFRRVLDLFPEVELETVVCDEAVDQVVGAIIKTSKHLGGDGYVVVTPVDQCYRIRSGAREF